MSGGWGRVQSHFLAHPAQPDPFGLPLARPPGPMEGQQATPGWVCSPRGTPEPHPGAELREPLALGSWATASPCGHDGLGRPITLCKIIFFSFFFFFSPKEIEETCGLQIC